MLQAGAYLEQAVKQRLVGVAVLAALAVITLPMIFDTERPPAVQVPEDIPPRPVMPEVAMPAPQPVELPADRPPGEPVPVGQMYQMAGDEPADTSDIDIPPGGVADDTLRAIAPGVAASTAPQPVVSPPVEPVQTPAPVPPPVTQSAPPANSLPPLPAAPASKLDAHGLPEGWVVQVAALSDAKKADSLVAQLKLDGYPAFTRKQDGTTRVLVGPKADKAQAVRLKQQLDREMKIQTMVKQFKP